MADPAWSRISDLVARALELPAAERDAFIAHEAGDERLREEVASLVEAAISGEGFLDRLGDQLRRPELRAPAPEPPRAGRRIGPWRLIEPLGRGGMGTVYLAERADGAFEQRVALKLLRAPLLGPEGRDRFTAERQILARLEHPAIARLLDGGILQDGVPWFAMEYVEGVPITEACDARRMTVPARLELFLGVCDAVDYAHRSLVVHRDLKPGNVLVNAEGEVKLLDFGVAKLLAPDVHEGRDLHPVTPAYAAPEQLRGAATTTATDVWALGVLLYELVTGRRPHEAVSADATDGGATHGPLTAPSERVTHDAGEELSARELAARRAAHPGRLHGRLAGDIDAIVCKALEPNPLRRYRGAAELADDLRRHRDRRPIRARAPSWRYHLRCFLDRHRVGVAAAAVIALLLLAVAGLAVHSALRARADGRRLALERSKAEAVSEFLLGVFSVADPQQARGARITARELLDRGARRAHTQLADQPAVQAAMLHTLGRAYRSLGLAERADPLLSQALRLRRGLGSGNGRELAATLHELGRARLDLGDAKGAEKLLREALKRYRELPVEAPVAQADTLFDLATTLSDRNDFAGAEGALRRAWRLRRRLGDQAAVAETLYAWGVVAHHQGRFEDGWRHIQEAVAIYRRSGRTQSPAYAQALLSMAAVRHGPRGNPQALEWARQALTLRRQIYGSNHPLVSEALLAVAVAAQDAGRSEVAERNLRQALRMEERHRSGSARHVEALTRLGDLLIQRGRVAEGIKRLERAVSMSADRPDSIDHMSALAFIGNALREVGRLDEAERFLRQRLRICRRVFGRDHPVAIRGEVDLARVDLAREDFAAAEPALRHALTVYRDLFDPDYHRIAEFEVDLSQALVGLGRDAEAESLLRHAAPIVTKAYGPDNPWVQCAGELLASLSKTTERVVEKRPAPPTVGGGAAGPRPLGDPSTGREEIRPRG